MDNKQIVRDFYEKVINAGQLKEVSNYIDPSYVEHSMTPGQAAVGIEGVGEHVQFFFKPFSELKFNLDLVVSESDIVVVRSTMTGVHTGNFLGIEPSGKNVETTFIDIFRIKDGKICEHWHEYDLPRLILEIKPGEESI